MGLRCLLVIITDRDRIGDVTRILSNRLCYYTVSFWTKTERLRSHPFHFSQLNCREQCYKRQRGRSGLLRPQ